MSSPTYEKGREKRKGEGKSDRRFWISFSRERVSSFTLSFCAIRPLAVVGTRGKAALRIETYAWVPVLRVFDKLREVGGFSLLGFILCLRTMLMLELLEAVTGRLIGPKTWDRIVWIYGTQIYSP